MSLGWETLTLQMCCAAGYVIRYVTLIHFTDVGKNVKNVFKLSLNAFDEVSSDWRKWASTLFVHAHFTLPSEWGGVRRGDHDKV